MPEHGDPLVFNAFAGVWQNASNQGPTGQPAPLTIGNPAGSQVAMVPAAGQSVQVDGGAVGLIQSAFQLRSGAPTESVPGYTASVIFQQGAVNEQVGHLNVSGLSSGTAQAQLMLSDSADGTIKGSNNSGTVMPGIGQVTWAFTTAHKIIPSTQSIQVAQSYNLNATDPRAAGGIPEDWHQVTPSLTGWGGYLNYIMIPVANGSMVVIEFYFTPPASSTNISDGTVVLNMHSQYTPTSGKRIPAGCDAIKTSGGNLEATHIRIDSAGACGVYGVGGNATFLSGSGIYALGI